MGSRFARTYGGVCRGAGRCDDDRGRCRDRSDGVTTTPCGACRQVMAEFGASDVPLSYANADGSWTDTTLGALLPMGFDAASLDAAKGSA